MNKTANATSSFQFSRMFQQQYGLIWVLLAMVVFFSIISDVFRTPDNLLEILRTSAVLSIIILGVTWIVAMGEIDLCYPDLAALGSVVTALFIQLGFSLWIAVLVAFLSGIVVGVINGYLIGYLKFPSLITTIGMAGITKAVANTLAKGQPIYIPSTDIIHFIVYGTIFKIPILFLIALAIYIICRFIQDRTTTGQHLYALGENRRATQEAGISEAKTLFFSFILSAGLASIGGILMTATLSSGNPEIGTFLFLDGLTVVYLGALIVKAGKPNVIGTFIGSILLSVLVSGLTQIGAPRMAHLLIKGALLVFGVVIVAFFTSRKRRIAGLSFARERAEKEDGLEPESVV